MPNVLLIEDDKFTISLVEKSLSGICTVFAAESIAAAKELLELHTFNLFVVDVELPDGYGFNLCSELRNGLDTSHLPIIILTTKSEVDDKLLGFSVGCDDYLTKPFDSRELAARVKSKLDRSFTTPSKEHILGDLLLSPEALEAFKLDQQGGRENLNLTQIEYKILLTLFKNENQLVPIEDLKKSVWGRQHVENNSLYSHVSRLKKKIGTESVKIKSKAGFYGLINSQPEKNVI